MVVGDSQCLGSILLNWYNPKALLEGTQEEGYELMKDKGSIQLMDFSGLPLGLFCFCGIEDAHWLPR